MISVLKSDSSTWNHIGNIYSNILQLILSTKLQYELLICWPFVNPLRINPVHSYSHLSPTDYKGIYFQVNEYSISAMDILSSMLQDFFVLINSSYKPPFHQRITQSNAIWSNMRALSVNARSVELWLTPHDAMTGIDSTITWVFFIHLCCARAPACPWEMLNEKALTRTYILSQRLLEGQTTWKCNAILFCCQEIHSDDGGHLTLCGVWEWVRITVVNSTCLMFVRIRPWWDLNVQLLFRVYKCI